VDIVYDMNDPLPFPDESVDAILCIHALEHLPQWKVPYVLREWYRVLKCGGAAWGRVPDTEAFMRAYLDAADHGTRERCLDALLGATRSNPHASVHEAHHAAFTAASLREAFNNGGFENVQVRQEVAGALDYVLIFFADKHAAPTLQYHSVEDYR
jgi:ubiquinone/menaquinone biosynthesis C-methylase UbiE